MSRKKAVQTVDEVKRILKEHKDEIAQKYKVKELGIFGSFVRGEQKKRSDVDILVDFIGLPDIFDLIDLEEYLKKLLKKKVDVVGKGAIRPELKNIILEEVLYI